MPKFRIGCHVDISEHTLIDVPQYANSIGCNIVQVFFGNPHNTIIKRKPDNELKELSHQLNIHKQKLVIHGSFAINLAHPINSPRHIASLNAIIKNLKMISIIGKRCFGLVIHMGKNLPENNISSEQAIHNYVNGLKVALKKSPSDTKIILETGASQGNEIGSRLESLALIYRTLTPTERNRIKFCIDTCHIWASGYDIIDNIKVKEYFDLFNKLIGINNIVCIHFNDSKNPMNSHVDRHADIGHGYIPIKGLKAVIKFAYKHKIPVILETPLDSINLHTKKFVTFEEELHKITLYVQ